MAFPGNFVKVVASGTYFVDDEFSFSLSLVPNGGPAAQPDATQRAAIATAISGLFTTNIVSMTPQAKLEVVKVNLVGEDGRYVNPVDSYEYVFPTPVAGMGSITLPPQCTVCVTLDTGVRRGPGHAGRFFPPIHVTPAITGQIPQQTAIDIATRVATGLEAINAAVPGLRVGVASAVGLGAFRPVTSVRVGRVVDTQRRRRNKLPELYESHALEGV